MSLFLGLDCGTQSLKALLFNPADGSVVATSSVHYGRDLPHHGCPDGFIPHADPLLRQAPPLMWVEAMDLALERLKASGAAVDQIAGVSGSGQQHGSVYLAAGWEKTVAALDAQQPLAQQLGGIFSRPVAPIWMDGSTAEDCAALEAALGSEMRRATGSPAIARFTGPQIRRFARTEPAAYAATARVHLVSSFLCSLLAGADCPVDTGDGAGMNLLDLATSQWHAGAVAATAPDLLRRLPRVSPKAEIVGKLSPYFARHGLTPGIPVVTWTGDNPASLVGVGAARPGLAVVSLGTSDTFFAALRVPSGDPDGCGHVFGNPAGGGMSLICFKNGSLARDRLRRDLGLTWDQFGKDAFAATPSGADGLLCLPWYEPEITPPGANGLRWSGGPAQPTPYHQVRALCEGQVAALRRHSRWIGDFTHLRVTGGASQCEGLLQVLADTFQATVEVLSVPDSAALGAALLAASVAGNHSLDELSAKATRPASSVKPRPAKAGHQAAWEAFAGSV